MPTVKIKEKTKHLFASLITCVACNQQMNIERSDPDAKGRSVVQYRCRSCSRIERLRLSS